jgi:hypothetical protein
MYIISQIPIKKVEMQKETYKKFVLVLLELHKGLLFFG